MATTQPAQSSEAWRALLETVNGDWEGNLGGRAPVPQGKDLSCLPVFRRGLGYDLLQEEHQLNEQDIYRLYRLLRVHTIGFHELLKDVVSKAAQPKILLRRVWRTFMELWSEALPDWFSNDLMVLIVEHDQAVAESASHKQENSALRERAELLMKNVIDHLAHQRMLDMQNAALEADLQEHAETIGTLQANMSVLEAENNASKAYVQSLRDQLMGMKMDVEVKDQCITGYQQQVDQLNYSMEVHRKEVEAMHTELQGMQDKERARLERRPSLQRASVSLKFPSRKASRASQLAISLVSQSEAPVDVTNEQEASCGLPAPQPSVPAINEDDEFATDDELECKATCDECECEEAMSTEQVVQTWRQAVAEMQQLRTAIDATKQEGFQEREQGTEAETAWAMLGRRIEAVHQFLGTRQQDLIQAYQPLLSRIKFLEEQVAASESCNASPVPSQSAPPSQPLSRSSSTSRRASVQWSVHGPFAVAGLTGDSPAPSATMLPPLDVASIAQQGGGPNQNSKLASVAVTHRARASISTSPLARSSSVHKRIVTHGTAATIDSASTSQQRTEHVDTLEQQATDYIRSLEQQARGYKKHWDDCCQQLSRLEYKFKARCAELDSSHQQVHVLRVANSALEGKVEGLLRMNEEAQQELAKLRFVREQRGVGSRAATPGG